MKNKNVKRPIKAIELFAGVGGFRLGLQKSSFDIIWSNQWEPATKTQHAFDIYTKRFGGNGHSNQDIATVDIKDIPDHDLLSGGFPCQDYSVARTLSQAAGIEGKKGVLWWEIYRIISQKKKRPKYLMLENVDRLLKSPASQRGRDFAVMIASLSDLGYAIEWRVINAADYGFPQRRRRVFIMGYYKDTALYKRIEKDMDLPAWVYSKGVFAKAFPIKEQGSTLYGEKNIHGDLVEISEDFNKKTPAKSPFENTGVMIKRTLYTSRAQPDYKGKRTVLGDLLVPDKEVPEEYFVKSADMPKWEYLKGAKHVERISKRTGATYRYDEGSMVFPDPLDKPSRTIVTGEGGSTPSRFKHAVKAGGSRLRRLTPVELERLNMFPDNHTAGVSDIKRAFFMGNALVVGVVERLGKQLYRAIQEES